MIFDILMIFRKRYLVLDLQRSVLLYFFNVPQRTLLIVYLMELLGGITKLILLKCTIGIVISTFAGASLVGILSVYAAIINMHHHFVSQFQLLYL